MARVARKLSLQPVPPVGRRVDLKAPYTAAQWSSGGSRGVQVGAGGAWAAPLCAGAGAVWARPVLRAALPYAPAHLDWRGHSALLHAECRAPPDLSYRCPQVRSDTVSFERSTCIVNCSW